MAAGLFGLLFGVFFSAVIVSHIVKQLLLFQYNRVSAKRAKQSCLVIMIIIAVLSSVLEKLRKVIN